MKDYIKKLYRFYYIGLYHRSAFELKSNTESSVGLVCIGVLAVLTILLEILFFKICNLLGIYFEQKTIIIVNGVLIVLDLCITVLLMKYIAKNIIKQKFIDSIEKGMKNYTKQKTLLIWFYGFLFSLSLFILFVLSLFIMSKALNFK